jgi:tetratricopeptide (TPR) repeat protein
MNLALFFDRLNKFSLYSVLILMPIFFLPFVQDSLNFPKQMILLVFVFLGLIGWLGKSVFMGKLYLKKLDKFYLALILIFISLLLSAVFSELPRTSLFGSPLSVTDSFLTFVLFIGFFFLVVNSFEKQAEIFSFLFFFLISGAFAAFLNLFQIYRVFILPFDFSRSVSFNTIGTTNSFALFSALVLPVCLILFFNSKHFLKKILGLACLVFGFNVLLINFKTAWLALIVALLLLFVFNVNNQKSKIKTAGIALLMFALVVSLFFYFFPGLLPGFPVLPLEVSLSAESELHILKNVFSEQTKNVFFGSGPASFVLNYSKYRPIALNQTLFWGTRFSEGGSSFLTWLMTKGIFGSLSLIFLYYLVVSYAFKNLTKPEDKSFYQLKVGLTASLIGLIVAWFFYPFNFVLYFTFWFLLACLIVFFNPEIKTIDLSIHLKMIFANMALILIVILGSSLFFWQGQRFLAEGKYLKAINSYQAGNVDNAVNQLDQAINLNPYFDLYWRDFSQVSLVQANNISQNPNFSAEQKIDLINSAIINGAEAVNQAIVINPNNVANWNVRGFFYQNLIGVEGAAELSLSSYQKATELEPASPFAFAEKARIYVLIAQENSQKQQTDLQRKNLDSAIEYLEKALELKSDYAPGHYLLAVVYDQKGELSQAASKLEQTKLIIPQDEGIAFQLGLLYWRQQQFNQAEQEFDRAVNLNPDYSNARYMLGLAYDQNNEKEKARQQFEIIAQNNPDNQEIKRILDNINQGLPALEEIVLPEPPLQETPPEIDILPF